MQQVEPYRKKRSLDENQHCEEIIIESDLLELGDYPKKHKKCAKQIAEIVDKEKTYFITDDFGRRKFIPNGVTHNKEDSSVLKNVKEKLLRGKKTDTSTMDSVDKEKLFLNSRESRGLNAQQVKEAQKEHIRKLNKWRA